MNGRQEGPRSLDTPYAGCLFRSALEARTAVFLDHLGIEWQYEYQGYRLPSRIFQEGEHTYLPDFWFPGLELYGEVKGELREDRDVRRLVDVAAALSSPGTGCGGGNDLIVFGHIPPHDSDHMPTRLHMHKGSLKGSAWWGESNGVHPDWSADTVAEDSGEGQWSTEVLECTRTRDRFEVPEDAVRSWLIGGSWACYGGGRAEDRPDIRKRFTAAYDAARSVRFDRRGPRR